MMNRVPSASAVPLATVLAEEETHLTASADRTATPRHGLALSGGGIRSATIAVGVLQWLIEEGKVRRFDYLSTVSGGGYAGAWLLGMLHRHPKLFTTFERGEGLEPVDAATCTEQRELLTDSLQHLRRYSNFLTPRTGLFGFDTFSGVSGYLRNVFLNAFLLYFVLASVLLLPPILIQITGAAAAGGAMAPLFTVMSAVLFGALALLIGLAGPWPARSSDRRATPWYQREPIVSKLVMVLYLGGASLVAHGLVESDLSVDLGVIVARTTGGFVAGCLLALAGWTVAGFITTGRWRQDERTTLGQMEFFSRRLAAQPFVAKVGLSIVLAGLMAVVTLVGHESRTMVILAPASLVLLAWILGWLVRRDPARWGTSVDATDVVLRYLVGAVTGGIVIGVLVWLLRFPEGVVWGGFANPAGGANVVVDPSLRVPDPPLSLGGHSKALMVALFGVPVVSLCLLAGMAFLVAGAKRGMTELDREWVNRWIGYVTLATLVWMAACAIVFLVPSLVRVANLDLSGFVAWLMASGATAYFARSLGTPSGPILDRAKRLLLGTIGPYLFVIGILVLVANLNLATIARVHCVDPAQCGRVEFAGSFWLTYLAQLDFDAGLWTAQPGSFAFTPIVLNGWSVLPAGWGGTVVGSLVPLLVAASAIAWSLGFFVDVNLFTFFNFYRNRLARCYLGASRFVMGSREERRGWLAAGGRRPHIATDFDPDDDLDLSELRDIRPYPIVNTAINLNTRRELAWQSRKAASFVFTPRYCGFQIPAVFDRDPQGIEAIRVAGGYQPTRGYMFEKGPKLMVPAAISGAAFTANAGAHTTPWMAFLLTAFGVRLGRWCASPVGGRAERPAPLNSTSLMVSELLGGTREDESFVYLSDGGHFENLGIYELVRRRVGFILAIDSSADPRYRFDDLANAIHKCRVDLDVEIDLPREAIDALRPGAAGAPSGEHVALGWIRYGAGVEPGVLVYVKASLTGDEPPDVVQYQREHPEFPHQTTLDQWFNETQFESYRALGHHIASSALGPYVTTHLR